MDRDEAFKLLNARPEGQREWARRRASGETIPALDGANFKGADLRGVDFSNVDLTEADLTWTRLSRANFRGACLVRANLWGAMIHWADLSEANLKMATLDRADLRGGTFSGTNFSAAACGHTIIVNIDLSGAVGLDKVVHTGPSSVGIDTLVQSKGHIPDMFLRGCGVPDYLIENQMALIRSMEPFQFYSCFISYSTRDEKFATKLHADFEAAGVRCWKWNHDVKTGQPIWGEIGKAIESHDRLVLIASEESLKSPQVNREIERAIQEEDRRTKLKLEGEYQGDTNVLFPVRLDDFIFDGWSHPRKADVTARVIADARGWSGSRKTYPAVRDRLIEDLKAEKSAGPEIPTPPPSSS